jgi:hypothetical protein
MDTSAQERTHEQAAQLESALDDIQAGPERDTILQTEDLLEIPQKMHSNRSGLGSGLDYWIHT